MVIHETERLPDSKPRGLCEAAAVLAFACATVGVTAAETSHGTHEHGKAEIELAVEGSGVVVNFTSPMYNLVGFEHAPRDEGDREAVAAASVLLDDAGNLVLPQADAQCTVVELDVDWDVPSAEEEHDDEAAEHDAHENLQADEHHAHDADGDHAHDVDGDHAHDADGDHAHEADGDHAHEADGDHHHDDHDVGERHVDVTVGVRYTCDHPDRLNSLDVTAFESFERLSEVEFRAVGPGGAVAESPERDSPRVDLRGLFVR